MPLSTVLAAIGISTVSTTVAVVAVIKTRRAFQRAEATVMQARAEVAKAAQERRDRITQHLTVSTILDDTEIGQAVSAQVRRRRGNS